MSLYHDSQAKDSCGFGLIAQLKGVQSQELVKTAISALTRMTHRGAINSDGKTGDGCGISIQISNIFFNPIAEKLGANPESLLAVGH